MNVKKLFDLKGSVAIITGGASGIGYQLAMGLGEVGANLVIASRRYKLCKSVSELFRKKFKIDSIAIKLDITKEEDVVNMVEKIMNHYGKIDILVNNAGGSIIKNTISTSLSEWNSIIDLNITGAFTCCREVGKQMIKCKYGKIINISSMYSIRAIDEGKYLEPGKNNSWEALSYCVSKGGIINLTRQLAVNWAKYNINVNAISPGSFFTEARKDFFTEYRTNKFIDRIPMKRLGGDDDLKGAVVFLASNASRYITGQNLVVDGGCSLWC